MSAVLVPANKSRARCLLDLAAVIAQREGLSARARTHLIEGVKRRHRERMSPAMNLCHTRQIARVLEKTPPNEGTAVAKHLRIHMPACDDTLLLVQTYAARNPGGEPHSLISEIALGPGDTVSATVQAGGAIVIVEMPGGH